MSIEQGLQHHHHVFFGHRGGDLHDHRLVELLDVTRYTLQPADDRGGQYLAHTLIDHAGLIRCDTGNSGEPGHGLLDENVTRTAQHTGRARPGHDLHRQDAVSTQVKEGLVDSDSVQPQNLGVDPGQDLLDGVGGRTVLIGIVVFGCRQGAAVEFAVDRHRQRVNHQHCRGHHIRRQPVGQGGACLGGVGSSGDVADEAFGAGAVLAGDDDRLLHPIQTG